MSNILSKAMFNDNKTIDMRNKWKEEYINSFNRYAPFKETKVKEKYVPLIS